MRKRAEGEDITNVARTPLHTAASAAGLPGSSVTRRSHVCVAARVAIFRFCDCETVTCDGQLPPLDSVLTQI